MRCPYCSYSESKVIDSRPAEEGTTIRRRRECLSCGKRFTTYEIMERLPLLVIKRDGSRQSFDRVKVINGMVKAAQIGEMIMDRLRDMDQVAYVRFASVYRQFKDINTFLDELNKLLKESK